YLRSSATAGAADVGTFKFGGTGSKPVAGDWDGNGKAGIGVFDPNTATWKLRNEASAGAADAGIYQYGSPGWGPGGGDWDGTGKAGLGAVDPQTGTWYLRNEANAGAPDAGVFAFGASGSQFVSGAASLKAGKPAPLTATIGGLPASGHSDEGA